ncbi:hypothetical protein HOF65_04410 [bacterium]|nr:hypothetical protein [bacterium]
MFHFSIIHLSNLSVVFQNRFLYSLFLTVHDFSETISHISFFPTTAFTISLYAPKSTFPHIATHSRIAEV